MSAGCGGWARRAASPWRNWNRDRSFRHRLTSGLKCSPRVRPRYAVDQPGDRASRKDREPRTEPNGNRDDRCGPLWQTVHGEMSPVALTLDDISRAMVAGSLTEGVPAFRSGVEPVANFTAGRVHLGEADAPPAPARLTGYPPVDRALSGAEPARSAARANRLAWGPAQRSPPRATKGPTIKGCPPRVPSPGTGPSRGYCG
jgi:hypothetical protein